jgi:hypothetical protein
MNINNLAKVILKIQTLNLFLLLLDVVGFGNHQVM